MKTIESNQSDDVPLAKAKEHKVYFLDIENDLIIIQKEKALLFYFKKSKFNESNTREKYTKKTPEKKRTASTDDKIFQVFWQFSNWRNNNGVI